MADAKDLGYVEGQNVLIEYRWAESQYNQLPELAADLVSRKVAVLAAAFLPAALAAKAATSTIPICFIIGSDPVKQGLVKPQPAGGNATGVAFFSALVGAKRLGLLRELVPAASIFALLVNPTNPNNEIVSRDLQAAAQTLDLQVHVCEPAPNAKSTTRLQPWSNSGSARSSSAPTPSLTVGAIRSWRLAARHGIPAIYERREVAVAGGLMSYGASPDEAYHQAGIYTGRILKGEKPTDLPVVQSAKFQLVLNLKTAKALGLTLPSGLLSIVDEVIE